MELSQVDRHDRSLCVAGITMRFSSDATGPLLEFLGASQRFEAADVASRALQLRLAWGELTQEPPGQLTFDSGGTWKLYENEQADVFRFWASQTGPTPYLQCTLSPDHSCGSVILHRQFFDASSPIPATQYPLDEVLMVHLLGRGLGVEVHACGVVTSEGRGYLFVGQSGHGKTTTARLWQDQPGVRILSDDRIIIRKQGGRFNMYGTPWHGEAGLATNASAPLDSIFVLEHAKRNQLSTLKAMESAALLAARSFVPFHDPRSLEWTLGFLADLSGSVPCSRFGFVPDSSARLFLMDEFGLRRPLSVRPFPVAGSAKLEQAER
ncbi:MAG: hypothetical protein IT186_25775 [Acidobacteria bacterium]|nr:hypothetical protein [Acidobacteriota bacterium]